MLSPSKTLYYCAVLSSAVPLAANAQDARLLGCWKTESVLIQQVNGETRKAASDCFDFFDAASVTNTCISKIGVVPPPRTNQYQLLGERRFSLSPERWEKKGREYEYRVDGDTLTRTQHLEPAASRGPEATIKLVTVAARRNASGADSCLPKPVVVSKEDAARYWSIVELVGKTLETETYSWALLGFIEGYQKPFPADAVSDENQARVLVELQKIAEESTVALRKALPPLAPRILEIFYRPGHCGFTQADQDLASPLKQAWAADSVQEIIGSRKLASYLPFFRIVAPEKLQELRRIAEKDLVDKERGLGRNYQLQRELLLRFPDSAWLVKVLPEGSQLSALRELSRKNAETAKANFFRPPDCLEREVSFTAQELRSTELNNLLNTELNRVKARGALLRERFNYVVDRNAAEMCAQFYSMFDQRSISQSRGDWRQVRSINGQRLTPPSNELWRLSSAYSSGCFGKPDTAAARRTLEVFADAHGDRGKIAASTHCQLARWYRYGIGGERNETRAVQWDARFRRDTGAAGSCFDDRQIIDPDDPWRIVNF